jgi:micrococcal nuclease
MGRQRIGSVLPAIVLAVVGLLTGCTDPGADEESKSRGASSGHARASAPAGVPQRAQRATVVRYVDGDTIHLEGGRGASYLRSGADTSVRLLEIDTPESVDPNEPLQCYAKRASEALQSLLPVGSTVWTLADRELLDQYGRTLLYLWNADGEFVNLAMVRSGHAKAVLYPPNDRYISLMRRAQAQAEADGRGLWGACDYFGEPARLIGRPITSAPTAEPHAGRDPRFGSCTEAAAAGYGDYQSGRDAEYQWYDDADGDGVVCER